MFTKSLDFSGVVVPFVESQRFCANIQLSGSVPAGSKRIESIDLVRYTEKNGVFLLSFYLLLERAALLWFVLIFFF